MTHGTTSKTLAWLMVVAGGAAACSVASEPASKTGWDCANVDVPNGTTVECTATNAAALTSTGALPPSYYCSPDQTTNPACPPAGVSQAGGSYEYDSGTTPPTGSGGGYTTGDTTGGDTTGGGGYTTGGGDTTGGGTTGAGGCTWDAPCGGGSTGSGGDTYDAGTGVATGNGNGNGGNPHGAPPGNSNGGNPHNTPSDNGGGYTTGGGDSGGVATGGGGSNGGSGGNGGYTCDCGSDGSPVCHKPPTCAPGTHPSACGACVPNGTSEDCNPPSQGGCWVTGGGFIVDGDGHDSFGGNAMPMKSGTIRGQWEHVDHGTGNKLHGEPSYIVCRHVPEPGPGAGVGNHKSFDINQVYFGGNARVFVNGAWFDGYWFDVMAEDHGEGKGAKAGGPDYYHITVRKISGVGQSGTVVYDTEADMSGGNIQIHPPNNGHPYTSSSLPSWVSLQP